MKVNVSLILRCFNEACIPLTAIRRVQNGIILTVRNIKQINKALDLLKENGYVAERCSFCVIKVLEIEK